MSDMLAAHPAHQSIRVALLDDSSVGAARRAGEDMAARAGLDVTQRGKLSLIITEAAQNAVKYGQAGETLFLQHAGALDVLVLDKGPGMVSVPICMQDGYSTGGTRGVGMGSIERQADTFDIFSAPERGTALFARVGQVTGPVTVGAVCLPLAGEDLCGDAWVVAPRTQGVRCAVVDGLGHGPQAAQAAHVVSSCVASSLAAPLPSVMQQMHLAARKTRGAAVGLADLHWDTGEAHFIGVGNISGSLCRATSIRNMASHNGIVGARLRHLQTFDYPYLEHDLLVLHSDGLQTPWSFKSYPSLIFKHPTLIAGVLYRDFSRGRDDVTVLVVKRATLGKSA